MTIRWQYNQMYVPPYFPPEVNVEPLGDLMVDFLINHDTEEAYLDFKEKISVSDSTFAKVAKDFFALSNFGGGFLLLGFRPKEKLANLDYTQKNFVPVGLPEDFMLDQAVLQQKFNSYASTPINIQYREFYRPYDEIVRRFAAIYVPGHVLPLKPIREGSYLDLKGRKHIAFRKDEILIRRGTQSVPASRDEIAWIEKRAKTEGYRISVLSGEPDFVQETIYSNLFEVVELPQVIWTGCPVADYRRQRFSMAEAAFKLWDNRIISFVDLTQQSNPLAKRVVPNTAREEELQAWLKDEDKRRVVIELLNREIRLYAERLHLQHEHKKNKFYYSSSEESRTETWKPRFKQVSRLKVAQRLWVKQIHKFLYWHVAVDARFTYIEGKIYLTLVPTIQLTEDGKRAVFGSKEGTAITRLVYNKYNASYLNSILFWAYKFSEGKDTISLRGGKIRILSKPASSIIDVGILSDKPASESMQSPEIDAEEV
jgi:hypothetical protein